jgi:uncharacterized membrane protein YebE (DUF533 family)
MNIDKVLSEILRSGAGSGFAGGLAGGLASGLLTSKAGRKLGKKVLQIGGLAAVAGVAYAAWQKYQQEKGGAPGLVVTDEHGLLMLRAMIAAAHADGRLEGEERRIILAHVAAMNLSAADRAALLAEIEQPCDLSALVAAAKTPELATEIYAASRLGMDPDTPAEQAYLSLLAARLGLPEAVVKAVDAAAEAPEPAAAVLTTDPTSVSRVVASAQRSGREATWNPFGKGAENT